MRAHSSFCVSPCILYMKICISLHSFNTVTAEWIPPADEGHWMWLKAGENVQCGPSKIICQTACSFKLYLLLFSTTATTFNLSILIISVDFYSCMYNISNNCYIDRCMTVWILFFKLFFLIILWELELLLSRWRLAKIGSNRLRNSFVSHASELLRAEDESTDDEYIHPYLHIKRVGDSGDAVVLSLMHIVLWACMLAFSLCLHT